MRSNIEDAHSENLRQTKIKYDVVQTRLVGTYVVGTTAPVVHFLDPNGADRDVFLPVIDPKGGQFFIVCNTGSANSLNVRDFGGTLVSAIDTTTKFGFFVSSPTLWRSGLAGASGAQGPAGPAGTGAQWRSGSGAPGAGLGNDGDMYVNFANGDLYGPKTAGAWGATIGNIKGPAGTGNVSSDIGVSVVGELVLYNSTDGAHITHATGTGYVKNTAGVYSVQVTIPAAEGGTGQAGGYTIGDLLYASGASALSKLAGVATGNALISGGVATAPTWGKIGLTTHVTGTLGPTNGGTGASTYALGDILYSDATNSLAKLAGNITTTRKFLRQTGGGAVSAAPAWDTIVAADVPGSALTKTDDTNVTLTLGGTPATALLVAASLTLGWTGSLAVGRGGTGGTVASGTLLDNITGFSSTGIVARTGAGAYSFRTVTGTANKITVTNGNGVSGDPSITVGSDVLQINVSATTTVGYKSTVFDNGTKSSGTLNVDAANGNYQRVLNQGAFVLDLMTSTYDAAVDLLVQNGVGAGAITFGSVTGGFRVGTNVGDTFATTTRLTAAVTSITNATPGVVNHTAHGAKTGDIVFFTTTGGLPTGLSINTIYWITVIDANSYKLSTTLANLVAGTFIATSSAGSGTHTAAYPSQWLISLRRMYGISTYIVKALQ